MIKKIALLIGEILVFIVLIALYVFFLGTSESVNSLLNQALLTSILAFLTVIVFRIINICTSKKAKDPYDFDYILNLKEYKKIVKGFIHKPINYKEWEKNITGIFNNRIKKCNIEFNEDEKDNLLHFWLVYKRNALIKVKVIESIVIPLSITYVTIYYSLLKVGMETIISIILVFLVLVIDFTVELTTAYIEKNYVEDVYEVINKMTVSDNS